MAWIKNAYRTVVDHLTKVLGVAGMAVMSAIAAINPEAVTVAAQNYSSYLGVRVVTRIGVAMFALVTMRGWYTGYKAKLAAAEQEKLVASNVSLQQQLSAAQAQLLITNGSVGARGAGA